MNKKQIINKIINDLPTRDMRGKMSPYEWYCWFEEAFDKGYAEALRIHSIMGRGELLAFKQFISKTPQSELEFYSDEEFTDLYIKANCS